MLLRFLILAGIFSNARTQTGPTGRTKEDKRRNKELKAVNDELLLNHNAQMQNSSVSSGLTRILTANHKTGSTMMGAVVREVCANVSRVLGTLPGQRNPAYGEPDVCLFYTTCIACHEEVKPSSGWLKKQSFESITNSRVVGISILRDPVKLILSQWRYHMHGFENGATGEVHEWSEDRNAKPLTLSDWLSRVDPVIGLQFTMTTSRMTAQIVGEVAQLVARNHAAMKQVCLEDFMASEASFYATWQAVFQFLELPIEWSVLREILAPLNPLSAVASKGVLNHAVSLKPIPDRFLVDKHGVRQIGLAAEGNTSELERIILNLDQNGCPSHVKCLLSESPSGSAVKTKNNPSGLQIPGDGMFHRVARQVACWDWTTNTRGDGFW
jgi:hypothetical protein